MTDVPELTEQMRLERLCASDRLTAADADRLLELRAIALAWCPVPELPKGALREVVVFRAGLDRLAVSARAVDQVRELGKVVPVPLSVPVCAGVVVHKGELIAVVDLAQLFRGEPSARTTSTRLLVLSRERQQLAILTDELVGVRTIDRGALTPPPSTFPPDLRAYADGVTTDGVAVLSLPSLMDNLIPGGPS